MLPLGRSQRRVVNIAPKISRRDLVTGLVGLCPIGWRRIRYLVKAHRVAQAGHNDEGDGKPTQGRANGNQVYAPCLSHTSRLLSRMTPV